jgi:oligoribonuclease NrnB/cAMP/cGMP phosphodiesterase (DHH superfamily)
MKIAFYHNNCPDGLASVWIASRVISFDNVIGIWANTNKIRYDFNKDDEYYVFDLQLSPWMVSHISKYGKHLHIFDHHQWKSTTFPSNVTFDIQKDISACELVWKHFYPNDEIPWFIYAIGQKDTGHFEDENLMSAHHGMEHYDMFNNSGFDRMLTEKPEEYIRAGNVLLQEINRQVATVLKYPLFGKLYVGDKVYKAAAFTHSNRQVHGPSSQQLIKRYPKLDLVVIYFYNLHKGYFTLSLRSEHEHVDVGEIAKKMNGGGHANAAGGIKIENIKTIFTLMTHIEKNKITRY